jgi:hypothetical protein
MPGEQTNGQKCPSRYGRHLWYRHGGYRTVAGQWQARERCHHCKMVRPAGDRRANRKRGPAVGGGPAGSDTYGDFWRTLVRRYPVVGLPAATAEAASGVGISAATARRWILAPKPERIPAMVDVPDSQLRLLEAAVWIRQGLVPRPRAQHLDRWQRIRSDIYGVYDNEHVENRTFREQGSVLWQAFLRAAAVAAVVLGERMSGHVHNLVPNAADTWVRVLDDGGLNRTGMTGRALECWVRFDDERVTVVLGTRRRAVGAATVRAGSWRPMTIRLRLDKAGYGSNAVRLPVPAATQRSLGGERDYPLILWFSEKSTWWDLDNHDRVHSP